MYKLKKLNGLKIYYIYIINYNIKNIFNYYRAKPNNKYSILKLHINIASP